MQRYRYDNGHYYSRTRYSVGRFVWPRGYVSSSWLIGEWLPQAFYDDDRYLVPQYWAYELYSPPYGYRWVRVGSDALLIDRYSGQVLDIVYSVFW
jgi:Ni/Co efflux regulator RcnB